MTPTILDILLGVLCAVLGALVGRAVLGRRRASSTSPFPTAPSPIDPSTDPRPTQGDVDDLDEQIQHTDDIIHDLEVHDARPQLPADFTLDRPDPNAVDLLREFAGEDDVGE